MALPAASGVVRKKGPVRVIVSTPTEQLLPGAGVQLNVCAMGEPEKPPLVLIHGIYDEWSSWELVYDDFLAEYRVYAVDLRGHGKSDKPARGYEPTDYAADVAGVIRSLGLSGIPVVGHSLGAVTTAYLAADYPELVKAAVLEDPPGRFSSNTGSRMLPMLEMKRATEEETYTFFMEIGPSLGEERWRDQTRRLRNTADGPFEVILEWAEKGEAPDVLATMARIGCPALLMQADPEAGGVLPDDLAGEIAARLSNGEHQKFPGVGHNIHKDAPAEFAQAALSFLRQHR
jgi:N-formylmaleamate deformylase